MTRPRCPTCGLNHDGTANTFNACEPVPPREDVLNQNMDAVALGLTSIMRASHADGYAVLARIRGAKLYHSTAADLGGFLTPRDVHVLASDARTRLEPVLVRCDGCRFTAPAQDVQHLIDLIERDDAEHVRDVSLPVEGHGVKCPACGQAWVNHDCPGEDWVPVTP